MTGNSEMNMVKAPSAAQKQEEALFDTLLFECFPCPPFHILEISRMFDVHEVQSTQGSKDVR